MELKVKNNGGINMDKRLRLLEKLKIQLQGHILVGKEQNEGWKSPVPVYMFKCKKHGIVKSTAKGYSKRLECPQCLEEIKKEIETVHLIEDPNIDQSPVARAVGLR